MAATAVRSAPLPEAILHVKDPEFPAVVEMSHQLVQKVLLAMPETHSSCIDIETLQLNSTENGKLVVMALNIGIPPAPVVRDVSESFPLETCLRLMSEGLQLHRALLRAVLPRLERAGRVSALLADIRDILIQIHKMLKMVEGENVALPVTPPVDPHMPGEYEVQVAAHLTLVQLQTFGQDMIRKLRSFSPRDPELTDS